MKYLTTCFLLCMCISGFGHKAHKMAARYPQARIDDSRSISPDAAQSAGTRCPLTAECRLRIADCGLQIVDCGHFDRLSATPQTADFGLPTGLCPLQTAHCRLPTDSWGFFGHRLINRMAIFTLPSTMIGLYKFNIDYISDHAVDPDKRRYASKHEAVRHYIDLDHWGEPPFENVPKRWIEMLAAYLQLYCINSSGDTIVLHEAPALQGNFHASDTLRDFVARHLLHQYYEETWTFPKDTVMTYFPKFDDASCSIIQGRQSFTQHGVLPYHLYFMQQRLTDAFAQKDLSKVLQLSADFGHYIADAHVPLHTTKNYNGQLTGQEGIHAFWESRIPELFAEKDWDFLVGQAVYITDPVNYYWDIVLKSHKLSDEVLAIEKELSKTFPADEQYCFEERNAVLIRTQCAAYADAYQHKMNGMVESRMQDAILAVGSAWFTAWVDGGQPQFNDFLVDMDTSEREAFEALEREFVKGRAFGREHE